MGYVLVTGASEGIGKALAKRAARNDRNLILTARSEDKLNALAAEINETRDIEVHILVADLNEAGAAAKLWDAARKIGQVDALINNAGLGASGAFSQTDEAREEATLQVNVMALTQLMRLAVRDMKAAGKGRIMNVASTGSFLPGPNLAVYHATKAYVLSLSEGVAQELAGTDVTVTALCPGVTKTEFQQGAGMQDLRAMKMGLVMSAKDVAEDGWVGMNMGHRIVIPGLMNKAAAFLPRILPRRVVAALMGQLYK